MIQVPAVRYTLLFMIIFLYSELYFHLFNVITHASYSFPAFRVPIDECRTAQAEQLEHRLRPGRWLGLELLRTIFQLSDCAESAWGSILP